LEELRNSKIITKNNEALVELTFDNQYNFEPVQLAKYLNVAKVIINNQKNLMQVNVTNAQLRKCERC